MPLVTVFDFRCLQGRLGGCSLHPKRSPRFSKQQQFRRIVASKDKKNFNAKKRASVKAKPGEAPKKVAAVVPPRIDCNSTIPVRRQQRLVQAKKQAEATAKRVPYKQTFRKPKVDPEQRAEEAKKEAENEVANRKDGLKPNLASLLNLYGTSGDEQPPVLLVDGYNVLFKFVDHIQSRRLSHSIEKASDFESRRHAFQESINTYSQTKGIKVVVVYDAIYRPADPVYLDIRTSTRKTLVGGVDVVFCSDQSADAWLIREIGVLQKEGKTPQILVATDDGDIVSSCQIRSVFVVSSSELVSDIIKSERKLERRVSARQQAQNMFGGSFVLSKEVLAFKRRKDAERREELKRLYPYLRSHLESDRRS